jgi:alpha-amylase
MKDKEILRLKARLEKLEPKEEKPKKAAPAKKPATPKKAAPAKKPAAPKEPAPEKK